MPSVLLPRLPPRDPESHKGDFGRALLIGGSRGMSGAVALAGMAALRSGAGLVRLAVPNPCVETVASFEASYMTLPLAADSEGRLALIAKSRILSAAETASCVALGPGLGQSDELTDLVAQLYQEIEAPLVIDADGLNALAAAELESLTAGGPRILTPHPGEFGRLAGQARLPRQEAERRASELAARRGVVILLKGAKTLITDGPRSAHNATGNPGMATGGTGDVLTGILCALVCQKLAPFDAAHLAAHVHGLAGDLAAEAKGQVGMIARDLVEFLPDAWQRVSATTP